MIIKNLKFKEGTAMSLVAKLYLEENKSKEEIYDILKTSHSLSDESIYNSIWSINRRLKKLGLQPETEAEVLPVSNNSVNNDKALTIKVYEKNKKLILFVKTCKSFEDYMIKHKEIRTTENLFNKGVTSGFYFGNLVATNELDNINSDIILFNSLNYGILRVKDISLGKEFEISKLITQEKLIQILEDFSIKFDNFYKNKILKDKINIELNIIGDKNEN